MTAIGDTIWIFDGNRRVYPPRDPNKHEAFRSPIWREHWRPIEIAGETSRSWIAGKGYGEVKVPKRGADPRRFAFSQAEIDEQAWVNENRYGIIRALEHTRDAEMLRKVAALIGYEAADGGR